MGGMPNIDLVCSPRYILVPSCRTYFPLIFGLPAYRSRYILVKNPINMPTALKRDVLLLLCYFTYRGVHLLDNEAVKELLPRSFHPPKKHHSLLRFIARFVAPGVEEKEKAGRGGQGGE